MARRPESSVEEILLPHLPERRQLLLPARHHLVRVAPASIAVRTRVEPVSLSIQLSDRQAKPLHTFLAVTSSAMPVRTGSYAARSCTWICTPPMVFPWNLEKTGAKYASLKWTPGRPSRFTSAAQRPSMPSAPSSSKGRVVPRPSERLVPSKRHVPEYTRAVSGVGMFGLGGTHGSPDAS